MRKWSLPPLLVGALHAATIRGAVVENFTGQPLSRGSVLLEPVPGSPGTRMTAHTDRFGFFEFAGEPAGRWEFALAPVDGYCASGFFRPGPYRRTVHAEGLERSHRDEHRLKNCIAHAPVITTDSAPGRRT
jgi:hypothetical protein